MKLLDSNILIYAAQTGRDDLRENILAHVAAVSVPFGRNMHTDPDSPVSSQKQPRGIMHLSPRT